MNFIDNYFSKVKEIVEKLDKDQIQEIISLIKFKKLTERIKIKKAIKRCYD